MNIKNKSYDNLLNQYGKYIKNSNYVYIPYETDWIIILKKITKISDNSINYFNKKCAKYFLNINEKLQVVEVINKFQYHTIDKSLQRSEEHTSELQSQR